MALFLQYGIEFKATIFPVKVVSSTTVDNLSILLWGSYKNELKYTKRMLNNPLSERTNNASYKQQKKVNQIKLHTLPIAM